MKVTNFSIEKIDNHGEPALACTVTFEGGSQVQCAHPWRNQLGLWASSDDARNPDEMCATLRSFALAIEKHCKAQEAA